MPRLSERALVKRDLENMAVDLEDYSEIAEEIGLGPEFQYLSEIVAAARLKLESTRYLVDRAYRRKGRRLFAAILSGQDTEYPVTDEEFLFHYRMTRQDFSNLLELLEEHPVFQSKPRQAPPAHQILVLLKYLGTQGNQASNKSLGKHFGIGSGTAQLFRERALCALLSLKSQAVFWPGEEERKIISNRIMRKYLFPYCVGFADGTLLPLAFRPTIHGENYLDRKRQYSLTMLIVCDEEGRILYFHLGWPGSVHDNRVWRNCRLYRERDLCFGQHEYLLGDSAYNPSLVMIPAFKSPAGGFLDHNKSVFNDLLKKPRVKTEHTIGLLKGRFPFLRDIRIRIRRKSDVDNIFKYVVGAVILHNLLTRNDGQYEEDWIDNNEFASIDDDEGMCELLNEGAGENGDRRQALMVYLAGQDEVRDRFN